MSKHRAARRRAASRAQAVEPTPPPAEGEGSVRVARDRPPGSIELPTLFAFVGSGCLLVLELVAARLIAPLVGVSLYTWTSVIGVVLGGVSLGNYIGGRLADRWPIRSALALVYLAAAAASVAVLGVLHYAQSLELPNSAPALLQVLWLTAILFLLPSTILGAPTPILTRLSLASVDRTGRVVGRIQAAAACGSIFGTFLTGFLLISWFGTRLIVAGVAGLLLLLAVAARPPWLSRHAYEVGALAVLIGVAGWASHSGCLRESSYYCIRVEPQNAAQVGNSKHVVQTPVRALFLDRLVHSVVDTSDPTRLVYYGYERKYAQVIKKLEPAGSTVDSYFIGGGGYTFPRWMEANYVGEVTVAEIDPSVTSVARKYLALDKSSRLRILSGDARLELREMPASRKFDAVFGDAFDDFEVPYHLTTREFDRLVASHLRPNGLYLLNVIDSVHYDFLRSVVRTLREVFPYVGVIAPAGEFPPPSNVRSTFVIVAAPKAPRQHLGTVLPQVLQRFVADGHSVVLTDDYAPVDQLLAPVFEQELQK
jgi:predicted membrane-bound spermidine synthase